MRAEFETIRSLAYDRFARSAIPATANYFSSRLWKKCRRKPKKIETWRGGAEWVFYSHKVGPRGSLSVVHLHRSRSKIRVGTELYFSAKRMNSVLLKFSNQVFKSKRDTVRWNAFPNATYLRHLAQKKMVRKTTNESSRFDRIGAECHDFFDDYENASSLKTNEPIGCSDVDISLGKKPEMPDDGEPRWGFPCQWSEQMKKDATGRGKRERKIKTYNNNNNNNNKRRSGPSYGWFHSARVWTQRFFCYTGQPCRLASLCRLRLFFFMLLPLLFPPFFFLFFSFSRLSARLQWRNHQIISIQSATRTVTNEHHRLQIEPKPSGPAHQILLFN